MRPPDRGGAFCALVPPRPPAELGSARKDRLSRADGTLGVVLPIEGIEVTADGAGALAVRWEPLDPTAVVAVAVGLSADSAAHAPVRSVDAGARGLRVTGLPPGRHYVSLSTPGGSRVVAERRVPLSGAWNFRDLGGYPVASGGVTRWGALFRSDSLHNCTPEDAAHLEDLGLRAVFDLRRDEERDESPGPRSVIPMTISGGRLSDADNSTLRTREDGERWLFEDYLQMLALAGPDFGRLFDALARPAVYPAVFHCMGGKDRTGMAAALLLSWLGVDREIVLDDYELTGALTPAGRLRTVVELFVESGIKEPAAAGLLSSPRWAMAAALDRLDAEYGGIERYLRQRAGLSGTVLAGLRENLVV
jgi:protein-tyrosine phosphatase